MPENSIDLIQYLSIEQQRFSVVTSHLASLGIKFVWSFSLRYTFLSYDIDLITPQHDEDPLQFYRWTWNMDQSQNADPEIHCSDKDVELLTRNHIHPVSYSAYKALPVIVDKLFTEEVMNYIEIADDIAKQGYQCNSGDNYHPGYFSEILISSKGIFLSQINKWNSRSIDHKDNYTMRELQFSIPYDAEHVSLEEHGQENIGRMSIKFSDHSSQSNRGCGDLIREKIKLRKLM